MNMNLSDTILRELSAQQNPQKAVHMARFFKTGKGEYAQGDLFWGLTSAQVQKTARSYAASVTLADLNRLFAHPFHEARSCAVCISVLRYQRAKTPADRQALFDFFVSRLPCANNWDLIDISVYKIIGAHLFGGSAELLFRLAKSKNLWEQRAAIVSTFYFIKRGRLDTTFSLCEGFLCHPHDLIHKACGWMLREAGKRDEKALCSFLDKFAAVMPRTMLRYSLEKLAPAVRTHYMQKGRTR